MEKFCLISIILMFLTPLLIKAVDKENKNTALLFKIERSKDDDEIYYEVNITKEGNIDQKKPIDIYWIKHTENGKIVPLTKIQNNLSYGLKFLNFAPGKVDFRFAAFSKVMTLEKTADGTYHVFTEFNDKKVKVERIFVQFDGGTFLVPKIANIAIYSKVPVGGELVVEVIEP